MQLKFIRANKTKFGGAENYLSWLSTELSKNNIIHQNVHSKIPKFLPSWLRAILFNIKICLGKKNNFYFSLERITCPDIYRAGDGVHKVFLQTIKKSKLNPLHPIYLYLERKCFKNAKHIIAISQMVKSDIINSYNVDANKISVIYNGINLHNKGNVAYIKREFNLADEKVLLYVGSGFKRKGVKEFLELIAKLTTQNIKVFIVGKEKKTSHYQELAKKLNISDKVIFTGPRSDVYDFYALSDIFIFPTHYEPFGSVILEAMNGNNAIFTTNKCGGGEILDRKFIMQTPNEDISKKIDNLLQNPLKLQQVKEQNYHTVQNFSIENNTKQTLKIINTLYK